MVDHSCPTSSVMLDNLNHNDEVEHPLLDRSDRGDPSSSDKTDKPTETPDKYRKYRYILVFVILVWLGFQAVQWSGGKTSNMGKRTVGYFVNW